MVFHFITNNYLEEFEKNFKKIIVEYDFSIQFLILLLIIINRKHLYIIGNLY